MSDSYYWGHTQKYIIYIHGLVCNSFTSETIKGRTGEAQKSKQIYRLIKASVQKNLKTQKTNYFHWNI